MIELVLMNEELLFTTVLLFFNYINEKTLNEVLCKVLYFIIIS